MVFLLPLFMFSAGYFWQSSFDVCKEIGFRSEKCELQLAAEKTREWKK